MLNEFVIWLNALPLRYWIVAWLAFAACLLAAVLPRSAEGRFRHWNSPVVFSGLLFLLLLDFRWPGLRLNFQLLNPDESQMIASAIGYRHYGTLWGHISDGTVGPLIALPLTVPPLLDLPFDYTTARFIGLFFGWSILVFLWLTLRHIHGDRFARLLILPFACFLAFTTFSDFVQYSTEPPALAYVFAAFWLLVTASTPTGKILSLLRLTLGGVILGVIPLAKPQVAPLGFVIGLWSIGRLLIVSTNSRARRYKAAACLLGGTLVSVLGFTYSLWRSGEFEFFWRTYVIGNSHYAAQRGYPWSAFPVVFWYFAKADAAFLVYLVSALVLLAMVIPLWPRLRPETRQFVSLGGMLWVIAFVVIIAPGRLFFHYLQILPPFLTLFVGFIYGGLLNEVSLSGRRRIFLMLFFLIVGLGPQVSLRLTEQNPYLGSWQTGAETQYAQYAKAVARRVIPFVRHRDTMTVWGWAPILHVEIGLPQATREINMTQEMLLGPGAGYLQDLYVADLKFNRPVIFIDAAQTQIPRSFSGPPLQPHEMNPAVRDFVAASYVLVDEIAKTRIYVRRDRFTGRKIDAAP